MSTRTPSKKRPAARSLTRLRAPALDPIPTIAEAKRRLAAAAGREQPWLHLTPEFEEAMARAEEEAGGFLGGPEAYPLSDEE